ncbi:MAG: nicotinate (nicotinamide) nucleotide adenylyltransferase, partial [Planctomycetes bacterium]|nr:nicotinate (nicotinamide) nucleotide adenylyltransferase [Planctomycetota bacterium]
HLIIARSAAEQLNTLKVILIPSSQPPHKTNKTISAAQDRLEMTRLAVQDDALFEVSDCELKRPGPSYTLETVRFFRQQYPQTQLYWLIGADSISELVSWYHIKQLADECLIVTAARPGFNPQDTQPLKSILTDSQIQQLRLNILKTPRVDISATQIRLRTRQKLSVSYLTPPAVIDYIKHRNLYTQSMAD